MCVCVCAEVWDLLVQPGNISVKRLNVKYVRVEQQGSVLNKMTPEHEVAGRRNKQHVFGVIAFDESTEITTLIIL